MNKAELLKNSIEAERRRLASTKEGNGPFRGTCRAIPKLVELASFLQSVCNNHWKQVSSDETVQGWSQDNIKQAITDALKDIPSFITHW